MVRRASCALCSDNLPLMFRKSSFADGASSVHSQTDDSRSSICRRGESNVAGRRHRVSQIHRLFVLVSARGCEFGCGAWIDPSELKVFSHFFSHYIIETYDPRSALLYCPRSRPPFGNPSMEAVVPGYKDVLTVAAQPLVDDIDARVFDTYEK